MPLVQSMVQMQVSLIILGIENLIYLCGLIQLRKSLSADTKTES